MASDHNELKLENSNNIYGKYSNIWKLSQTLLNNPQVKEEIMKEI